jgi:hypothetical protein
MTFNGTFPGPTLIVDWGDNVVVHVTNNLEYNGTTVHWHGLRQLNNVEYDGVPGVTQVSRVQRHQLFSFYHTNSLNSALSPLAKASLTSSKPLNTVRHGITLTSVFNTAMDLLAD